MPFNELIPAAYSDRQDLIDGWTRFGEIVAEASALMAGKGDDEELTITAVDGEALGVVLASDVKRKFGGISWSLATGGVTNGGVGEVESQFDDPNDPSTWRAAHAAVQVDGLIGYALWHDLGLHYLALHETSHVTDLGLKSWRSCWLDYVKTGRPLDQYASSEEWMYNEQVANQIAKVIGRWIGLDELPAPSEGFPMVRNHLGLVSV